MQLDILMYCSIFYAIELLEAAKSNQLYKKVRFKKKKISTHVMRKEFHF